MVGLARGGSAVETRRYLLVVVVGRKEWTAREEVAGVGQANQPTEERSRRKGKRDRRRSARACSCSLADGEWRMTGRKCPRAASLNAVGQRVTE